MDVLIDVLTTLLCASALLGFVVFLICWMVYDNPLNFPALMREALRPRLSCQQRVRIVGGFYAGYTGTLKERDDANYRVEVDGGIGREKIAIRHLRPLLPAALPAPKEMGEECRASYPELSPDNRLRERLR